MAYELSACLFFFGSEHLAHFKHYIARQSRPCFSEDVPGSDQAFFARVEDLEYPAELREVDQASLLVAWLEVDGLEAENICSALELGNVVKAYGKQIPDDPMSLDEDVGDGIFWMWEKAHVLSCLKVGKL